MDYFTDLFNTYPPLWMIYPLLLLLPITLLFTCCVKIKNRQVKEKPDSRTNTATGTNNQSNRNSPRQSPGSSRSAKKSSIGKLESANSTNTGPSKETTGGGGGQEGNKSSTGRVRYIRRRGHTNRGPVDDEVSHDSQEEEDATQRWPFPPTLEQFNLMESDVDPSIFEEVLTDTRLSQVIVRLSTGQGLGLAIVGGRGSPSGDVPIYIKRILPESILQNDSQIKSGDELIAVNDSILYNVSKEEATQILSNVQGTVRLLLIQDL